MEMLAVFVAAAAVGTVPGVDGDDGGWANGPSVWAIAGRAAVVTATDETFASGAEALCAVAAECERPLTVHCPVRWPC